MQPRTSRSERELTMFFALQRVPQLTCTELARRIGQQRRPATVRGHALLARLNDDSWRDSLPYTVEYRGCQFELTCLPTPLSQVEPELCQEILQTSTLSRRTRERVAGHTAHVYCHKTKGRNPLRAMRAMFQIAAAFGDDLLGLYHPSACGIVAADAIRAVVKRPTELVPLTFTGLIKVPLSDDLDLFLTTGHHWFRLPEFATAGRKGDTLKILKLLHGMLQSYHGGARSPRLGTKESVAGKNYVWVEPPSNLRRHHEQLIYLKPT